MHASVNGVRLFFDVEGAKYVPDGPTMREKPTLLLLHGGPGFDHSIYKPAYSALADIAQIVYLDVRGNGRSEDGPREAWNLAQWGDDVRAFCDALGIADPIVLGASFGGMVALAYATRHPDHPSKLVLISTEAAGDTYLDRRVALFERFGGPEVGALARHRFLEADSPRDQAAVDAWRKLAFPVYTRTTRTSGAVRSESRRWGCTSSRNRVARATRSTCSHSFVAFSALPSCSAAKTIRCIRSRARRTSQPHCRRIWCSSNGLRIADTPWCLMHLNRPWGSSGTSSCAQNKTGARRRRI
jgi:pimeloyl-ACP methyl ester carboxylesterase